MCRNDRPANTGRLGSMGPHRALGKGVAPIAWIGARRGRQLLLDGHHHIEGVPGGRTFVAKRSAQHLLQAGRGFVAKA